LNEEASILISEGCTHHRQCEDIGTVKLPKWLTQRTGKYFNFEFTSGHGFPDDLSKYDLIIHCGACMLGDKEVASRMEKAKAQGIPITNYGTVIAHINGILERSTEIIYK
ncbi:MAG: [Eubacterium sp.]|nr:[FeFe] hydrogenase H-cluster maturation GTPase HydF [Eubacterium sp.]